MTRETRVSGRTLQFLMDKLVPIADCMIDPCVKAIGAHATGIQSPNRLNRVSYVMSHGGKSPVFQCRKPLGNRKSRALRRGKSNCHSPKSAFPIKKSAKVKTTGPKRINPSKAVSVCIAFPLSSRDLIGALFLYAMRGEADDCVPLQCAQAARFTSHVIAISRGTYCYLAPLRRCDFGWTRNA